MEPFTRIPRRSSDFEDEELRQAIDRVVERRRRATRFANLGIFTGYRIGLDIGNGNIGWCILFEEGSRLHFLTADEIAAHNFGLPKSAKRTQLPDLKDFVPLGTHKFEARENSQRGEKSFHKIRAEAKTKRGLLDARQRRRLHVKNALRDSGLWPKAGEPFQGHVVLRKDHPSPDNSYIPADRLRVRLLDPSFEAHPHDLGRALYNALKRRGQMKPVGRAGEDEDSKFASQAEANYRRALQDYGCHTVGEFLERCARDAKRDREPFRKRHRSLSWQRDNAKSRPKGEAAAKSYETFRFLTPTFTLIWEECERLKRSHPNIAIDEDVWGKIKETAEYRRSLKAKIPGLCEYFPQRYRCIRALPSFQRFRILEQVSHLRNEYDRELDPASFETAISFLEQIERMSLAALSKELGIKIKRDRNDSSGARSLMGAKTDVALTEAFGQTWSRLPIELRDDWVMRFLRRHWPPAQGNEFDPWTRANETALEREADAVFGPDALSKVDEEIAKEFEDKFSSMSIEAARLRACCYSKRLTHEEMIGAMRAAGSPKPELALYERLPYYGAVMPDVVVPAEGFAPRERTAQDELDYGRAANPDVHIVMNRIRKVVNAIIDMMGGILPTRCVIEMARSAFSEEQASAYSATARDREQLSRKIIKEIESIYAGLGKRMPRGPGLDNLVDRWKAAIRQGWRDYDGSPIQPSVLVDGSVCQLDHVVPAAFGAFRENNMFVSRFNQRKGRRLPWEAFKDDQAFRPALAAFAIFGIRQQIEGLHRALDPKRKIPRKRRESLENALKRANESLSIMENAEVPRPDVLIALERTLTGDIDSLVTGDADANDKSRERKKARPFRPSDQATLFRRFCWDRKETENEPAARDITNIGWNTKLALRYLRHLGTEVEAIKAWAPYALRCMFNVNKHRTDLRNHAVDAFLVAHFDKRVLLPAFNQLRSQSYEAIYNTRALQAALECVTGGNRLLEDFIENLDRLETILPTIGTAHRADNRWNPGDLPAGSFGALGGQNTYSFRPTLEERETLTKLLNRAATGTQVMTRQEILEFLQKEPGDEKHNKIRAKLAKEVELGYWMRSGDKPKRTVLKFPTSLPLKDQLGAFIDGEGKFGIIGASAKRNRRVISIGEFSTMDAKQRAALFVDKGPVYRSGDTVISCRRALVITGILDDTRIISYPVDQSGRESGKERITAEPKAVRFASDVLGRRLHQLRKDSRGLEPVPYPLRGE